MWNPRLYRMPYFLTQAVARELILYASNLLNLLSRRGKKINAFSTQKTQWLLEKAQALGLGLGSRRCNTFCPTRRMCTTFLKRGQLFGREP